MQYIHVQNKQEYDQPMDIFEWTDWMRPSDTIKSLKLTSSVLAKLNTGKQSDILSLI